MALSVSGASSVREVVTMALATNVETTGTVLRHMPLGQSGLCLDEASLATGAPILEAAGERLKRRRLLQTEGRPEC